jgi:hypothetical protein
MYCFLESLAACREFAPGYIIKILFIVSFAINVRQKRQMREKERAKKARLPVPYLEFN